MKHFYALSLVLLAGCSSSMPHPAANTSQFRRDLAGTPSILVIGDETVTSWGNSNTDQMRTFAGSPIGTQEATSSIEARLPALLAANRYDVVVVDAGIFDMTDPMWDPPCGDATYQTCNNLDLIATDAHAAGAKVIFCTLAETEAGSAGTPVLDENQFLLINEGDFNRIMTLGFTQVENAVTDIEAATSGTPTSPATAWTDDGLTFNALGASEATAAAQATISTLHINWGTRSQEAAK